MKEQIRHLQFLSSRLQNLETSMISTNTSEQAAVANCINLLQCFKQQAQRFEANRAEQEREKDNIGFNLFELISDHYYRETFHSDIINALLNPDGKHGSKHLYLNLFLEFIHSQHGVEVDLAHYSKAEVVKEEGRIDVLIKDTSSKRAIIIENKINNATDQYKQLPDYLQKVEKNGYSCDAIIYLRLNDEIPPDKTDWGDYGKAVEDKLKIVRAYGDGETEKDLRKGWLLKCLNKSQENSDAKFVLKQYADIIKRLGINFMNNPIIKEFYDEIQNGENFQTALSLKKMLNDLISYRVSKIIDNFKENLEPFKKIEIYNGDDVKFSRCKWGVANFGLDIVVEEESYSFGFWDTNNRNGDMAKDMLLTMRCRNEYDNSKESGVFVKKFKFPSEEKNLIEHITEFKRKLANAIQNPIS